MNPKTVWRKIFGAFFIGDRVQVPSLENRKGKITNKVWIGNHWEYEVEFDKPMASPIYPQSPKMFIGVSKVPLKNWSS